MTIHSTIFVGLDVHKDSIVAAYSVGFGEVQALRMDDLSFVRVPGERDEVFRDLVRGWTAAGAWTESSPAVSNLRISA